MKRLLITMLFAYTFFATHASANTLPNYYPEFFPYSGIVSQIDLSNRTIVINDAMFHLSDSLRFHTPSEEFASMNDLNIGDKTGVRFTKDSHGRFLATEIWQIPPGQMLLPLP